MTSPKDPDRTILDHSLQELRDGVRSSGAPVRPSSRVEPTEPKEPAEADKTEWMAQPSLMQLMASRDATGNAVAYEETQLQMQATRHIGAEPVSPPAMPAMPAIPDASDEHPPRNSSLLSRLAPRRILTQFRREQGHAPEHATIVPNSAHRTQPPAQAGKAPSGRHGGAAARRMEHYEPTRTAIAFDLPPHIGDPTPRSAPHRIIGMMQQLLHESSPQARMIFLASMTASFLMFATILWKRTPQKTQPEALQVPASVSTPSPVGLRDDKPLRTTSTKRPLTPTHPSQPTDSPNQANQTNQTNQANQAITTGAPNGRNAVLHGVPSVSAPTHLADEEAGASPQAFDQAAAHTSEHEVGTPESIAIGKVIQGRYREALAIYKELLATRDGHIVYQSMARILERKLSRSCVNGVNSPGAEGERCDSTR